MHTLEGRVRLKKALCLTERAVYRRLFMGLTTTFVDQRGPSFRPREFFLPKKALRWGEKALCCPDMVLCRLERGPVWT